MSSSLPLVSQAARRTFFVGPPSVSSFWPVALPGREAAELGGRVELTLAGLAEVPGLLDIFRDAVPGRTTPTEADFVLACDKLVVDFDRTSEVPVAGTFATPPARSTRVFRGSGLAGFLIGAGIVVFMLRFVADCSCNGTIATLPPSLTGDESRLPCGNGREDPRDSAMSSEMKSRS